MAKRSLSVLKRARQAERQRLRNRAHRSRMRTAIKKVRAARTRRTALKRYPDAQALIDRTVRLGVIHPNTGARLKSRLLNYISKLK